MAFGGLDLTTVRVKYITLVVHSKAAAEEGTAKGRFRTCRSYRCECGERCSQRLQAHQSVVRRQERQANKMSGLCAWLQFCARLHSKPRQSRATRTRSETTSARAIEVASAVSLDKGTKIRSIALTFPCRFLIRAALWQAAQLLQWHV